MAIRDRALYCCFLVSVSFGFRFAVAKGAQAETWNDPIPVDLKGTNIPSNLTAKIDAVGWLSNGCTASHIGQGLAVTAGHCVLEEDQTEVANADCKELTIKWGFRNGQQNGALTSQCLEILIAEATDDRDFAILKVNAAPASALALGTKQLSKDGQMMSLLSHPMSEPLVWSQYCFVLPGSKEYGALTYQRCFADPGSSGAPILNATNGSLIGIHNGEEFEGNKGFLYGTFLYDTPIETLLKPK